MRQPPCITHVVWWLVDFLVIVIAVRFGLRTTNALQQLTLLRIGASDKGNTFHRYQPPLKTSVLKQLLQGRSSSSNGGNGGSGNQSDIGPNINSAGTTRPNRPTTAQLAFSGTIPLPSPTFEQRMRNIVLGNPRQRQKEEQQSSTNTIIASNQNRPANVQMIETLQQYKIIVGDESDKIVAVRFYATYCKACHAVAPHFYRLATIYPETIFIDVPVTASNTPLHQGLGVPTLPYAHIYHPTAGLVEQQKLTRNHIQTFKTILRSYITGSCPVPFDDDVSCQQSKVER